jgi:hypothetical protein
VVEDGVNGFSAVTTKDFFGGVTRLVLDAGLRRQMSAAARQTALAQSWESVFASVYEGYATLAPVTKSVRALTPVT